MESPYERSKYYLIYGSSTVKTQIPFVVLICYYPINLLLNSEVLLMPIFLIPCVPHFVLLFHVFGVESTF